MNQRNIHSSWLIAVGSVGILFGNLMSLWFSGGLASFGWIIGFMCLCGICGSKIRTKRVLVLALAAGLSFGWWRGAAVRRSMQNFEALVHKNVTLTGRVTEDPGIARSGDTQLRIGDVYIGDRAVGGMVWVTIKQPVTVKRSDVVTVEGQVMSGFGTIAATISRARLLLVERADYADVGRDVRDSFANGIRQSIQEPEASLASGYLVGQKTALPEKLNTELRLLGLTHIIVASGFNLTILVRFARKFLVRISRFSALSGAVALVLGFAAITGLSPSMERAAFVTLLSLIAWYFGRKIHPFVLIAISGGVTVFINPSYGWGDIGWLLSFTSFIGVIILAPLIHAYLWGDKKPGVIRQVVLESLAAQVLTFPIIAYVFSQYSPLSLIANVLIVPLIPLAMVFIALAGLCGMIAPSVAAIVGFPASLLLRYTTAVVERLAAFPVASKEIHISIPMVVGMYALIYGIVVYVWKKSGHAFRSYNVVE